MNRRPMNYRKFNYVISTGNRFARIHDALFIYAVYGKDGRTIKFDFNTVTRELTLIGDDTSDVEYIEFEELSLTA